MLCPLCKSSRQRSAPFACSYAGTVFPYAECLDCRSSYCDPMPGPAMLATMYGPEYETAFSDAPNGGVDDPKEPARLLDWLKRLPSGTFVDYGCGKGTLLTAAVQLGWRAIGIELDPAVARRVQGSTGCAVLVSSAATELSDPIADVLHLGDVIEHLTEMDMIMSNVLRLLKPWGLLLAQGPLEANFNIYAACIRIMRRLRGDRPTPMAPYHVILATSKGQRLLFQRLGLQCVDYSISEVEWPAQSRLALSDITRPRVTMLFTLRSLSKAVTALNRKHWGNRYFYAGRWEGVERRMGKSA